MNWDTIILSLLQFSQVVSLMFQHWQWQFCQLVLLVLDLDLEQEWGHFIFLQDLFLFFKQCVFLWSTFSLGQAKQTKHARNSWAWISQFSKDLEIFSIRFTILIFLQDDFLVQQGGTMTCWMSWKDNFMFFVFRMVFLVPWLCSLTLRSPGLGYWVFSYNKEQVVTCKMDTWRCPKFTLASPRISSVVDGTP